MNKTSMESGGPPHSRRSDAPFRWKPSQKSRSKAVVVKLNATATAAATPEYRVRRGRRGRGRRVLIDGNSPNGCRESKALMMKIMGMTVVNPASTAAAAATDIGRCGEEMVVEEMGGIRIRKRRAKIRRRRRREVIEKEEIKRVVWRNRGSGSWIWRANLKR